jgi:putative transcriptional regulator
MAMASAGGVMADGTLGQRPSHHLNQDMLMDYASGAVSEPVGTFVAAHLVLCAECRRELAAFEALGGVLLTESEPVSVAPSTLDGVLARLDQPLPAEPLPSAASGLPRPICRYVGKPLDQLPWRTLLPGLQEYRLPIGSGSDKVCLLRIKPGRAMPRHTHDGNEMTLVLRGSYTDSLGRFGPGDVAIVDGSVDHQPVADRDEDCICLAVTDAPLRLTGPIGRLFRPFFHF